MNRKSIVIVFLIIMLSSCNNKVYIDNTKDYTKSTIIDESTNLKENKLKQNESIEETKKTGESNTIVQNIDDLANNSQLSGTTESKEIISEENNKDNLDNKNTIYNKDIVKLSGDSWKKLIENKFVFDSDNKYKEFFEIYKKNRNYNIPNFITVDSLLHTYNVYLWNLRTKIETNKLYGSFINFSENILPTINNYYDQLKETEMEKDIRALKAYFTVPLKIANRDYEVDNYIADVVEREILAIDGHKDERIIRPIFNEFASEYNESIDGQEESQAGEYKKYESSKHKYEKIKPYYDNYKIYKIAFECGEETVLRDYYQILLWYRQIKFILEDEHLTKMALLMSYALKDSGLIEEYKRIDYVINYFLSSSHLGPNEYITAISEIYGANEFDVNSVLDKNNFERFVNRSKELIVEYEKNIQKINKETKYNVSFRFIGMPHTYEEEIFDNMRYGGMDDI